jgi:hypothetical protein
MDALKAMDGLAAQPWVPLALLKHRFAANAQSLNKRYPELAGQLTAFLSNRVYYVQIINDNLQLGIKDGDVISAMPSTLPAATAQQLVGQIYPTGKCNQPVLIVGEDVGWLWDRLYRVPCEFPAAPGHQPPLHFLMRDIERLWILLHLHDWRDLLADPRVRLFVGSDALTQFQQSLVTDICCPWPRLSVNADPVLWSGEPTLDAMIQIAIEGMNRSYSRVTEQLKLMYAAVTRESVAAKFRSGAPLRILGITSIHTTFLQYSMRDWLAAFDRLGHTTHLLIESDRAQLSNNLNVAKTCADFRPDLVVVIDHFRAELNCIPQQIPFMMWVQDALPNMFCGAAGAAQGDMDFAMGFARLRMIHEFGYPAERYMPTVVGCDEMRFAPAQISQWKRPEFACDVSFVSHASMSAAEILSAEIRRLNSPDASRLLSAIYEKLRAIYDAGEMISEPPTIRGMIDRSLTETRLSVEPTEIPKLMEFFGQRINNALFRHQSLQWVADAGVNLHLYGRGWESHPTLRRFARGVAANNEQLCSIYQTSKISLQISPHGAVHQRMMEGLACGGFFMIRRCPGDLMEREFQKLWNWCQSNEIMDDAEMRLHATPEIAASISTVAQSLQYDPFQDICPFIDTLRSSEESGYIRAAGTVWGEDYDAVSYGSAAELASKVAHFLSNDSDRARIAASMRQVVLDRFTYTATSRRLMKFISENIAVGNATKAAA